jgi:predicted alpha/beta-fold hydrolase
MPEFKKPPFYKSCMFWVIVAVVVSIGANWLAMYMAASAKRAEREKQQAMEQVEQE